MISGITVLLALAFAVSVADANVLNSCTTYCHGMPPRDGIRKANPHFDSQSSAFYGNHRNHLPAAPVAASCNVCHSPVLSTDFGHQNGIINMTNSIKGYSSASIRAKYDRGLFFNQTSIPNLAAATCSNVNCHFEAKSPAWNAAPLTYPAGCSVCHGAPPAGGATGTSGSHVRHDAYFTGASGCQKCHPGYITFSHATSAGSTLLVQGYLRDPANNLEPAGSYSGTGTNYFPSQSAAQLFGSCNTIYCHSSGQGATGTGVLAYQSVAWGGAALNCGSCHKNMATDATATGSHQLHATATTNANGTGANYTCQVCHGLSYSRSRTPVGLGGSHVNKNIELSFTTISGANAAGTTYSKSASFAPGAAYGQCSTSVCHGSGRPVWGVNTTRPECFKCHGSTVAAFTTVSAASVAPGFNGEGRDTAGNSAATSPRVGAHQTHLTAADNISSPIHCGECHITHLTVKDATHLNFTTATITFGSLAKSGGHLPGVTRTAGVISCSNTYCHAGKWSSGSSMTPAWVNTGYIPTTISVAGCGNCHGFPPAISTGHPAATAPTGFPVGSNCSCHANLSATGTTFANIFVDKTKHINGSIEATGGHAFPYPGATHGVATGATNPAANCSCHDYTNTGTYPVASGTSPNCKSCHTLGLLRAASTSSCWDCHGAGATDGLPNGAAFPNNNLSHAKHASVYGSNACSLCHTGGGTGTSTHGSSNRVAKTAANVVVAGTDIASYTAATSTCNTIACHGGTSAQWGVTVPGCVNCHAGAITRTKGRPGVVMASVVAEFGLAWSHKRTAGGAVTDADCIVCHLEGDATTQRPSAKHADGNIDLRDPDGTGEQAITNVSTNGVFVFQRFSTSYAAGSRTTTGHLSDSIDNVITQKFCLKCHDAGGAANPAARIPTTGTAFKPFGTTIAGAGYVTPLSAGVAGGVVDVDTQLSVTNSSYHPVKGPNNNSYVTTATINAPYGVAKVNGTPSNGVVMNCFDCHNVVGTPLTRRTVAAHGNAVTVRGVVTVSGTLTNGNPPSATNDVTFCKVCHSTATYQNGTNRHGAGSAFTSSTDKDMIAYVNYGCNICHSSGYTTAVIRPVRGQDVHGVNVLPTGGLTKTGRWSGAATGTPALVDARPYAFIRNTQVLPNHVPLKNGATTYSTACMGGNASPCSQGTQTYAPGGTY